MSSPSTKPLPDRVEPGVPLAFSSEGLPAAVQTPGLVVRESVRKGQLLFKINDPIAVIGDSEDELKNSCDNCFATIYNALGRVRLFTIPHPNLQLFVCDGCRIVYYCSEECQAKGWNRHHQYECTILKVLREDPNPPAVLKENNSTVYSSRLRLFLRFMLLAVNGKVARDFAKGFAPCQPYPKWSHRGSSQYTVYAWLVLITKEITETPASIIDLMRLVTLFDYHKRPIFVPIMKYFTGCMWKEVGPTTGIGRFVDPFVSLCKHSCNANAIVIFEGNELRVRALKSIAKDEEITLNLAPGLPDYNQRAQYLSGRYFFNCTCTLCKGPLPFPSGNLRIRTMELSTLTTLEAINRTDEIENCIADILKAGFGYGSLHMRALHETLMSAHAFKYDFESALKVLLKMFYVIEPLIQNMGIEPLSIHRRMTTLDRIVSCLEINPAQVPATYKMFPTELSPHIVLVYHHLKYKVLTLLKLCFGKDTRVVQGEVARRNDWMAQIVKHSKDPNSGIPPYRTLKESEDERNIFVASMNVILEWSGVGKLEDRHLL